MVLTADTQLAAGSPSPGILRSLLAVIAVVIYFTNFVNILPSLVSFAIPFFWIVGFVAILPVLMAQNRVIIPPIFWWAAGYILLTILWYPPFAYSDHVGAEIEQRFIAVTILISMAILFSEARTLHITRCAIAAATVFGVLFNLFELFNPGIYSTSYGRAAGLFRDSNQSGAALVLGLIIAQDIVPRRWRSLFWVFTGIGVLATFSRAAILGYLGIFVITNMRPGRRTRGTTSLVLLSGGAAAFVLSPWWGSLLATLEAHNIGGKDGFARLISFLGDDKDSSATERAQLARMAWQSFLDHPILGTGTGSSVTGVFSELGPHNVYLALGLDHGIIGLLAYPALVALSVLGGGPSAKRVTVPFACFALFWGFFSHHNLAEPYFLLSFAVCSAFTVTSHTESG